MQKKLFLTEVVQSPSLEPYMSTLDKSLSSLV